MTTERFLDHEQQFWLGDAGLYHDRLADDALMVFAEPVGVLDRHTTISSIDAGARWADVQLSDARLLRLADDAVLIVYRATARRPDDAAPYEALASSAYVRRNGEWRLAFHQQSQSPSAK